MKHVLIYGDSLVHGKKPAVPERFPFHIRFTGVVQEKLGAEYHVIEEGLRARNLFGENQFFPERNGLQQFGSIFGSHIPLDLVVIMLGTNNCNKTPFLEMSEFGAALDAYRTKIQEWCTQLSVPIPKLLIVAPPYILAKEVALNINMQNIFGPDSEERSKKLEVVLREYCEKNAIDFFAASEVCTAASGEGVHLDEENNRKLGEALAAKIKAII